MNKNKDTTHSEHSEDSTPLSTLSDEDVRQFLKEYDEGEHPLPQIHADALKASRSILMRTVREILRQRRGNLGSEGE